MLERDWGKATRWERTARLVSLRTTAARPARLASLRTACAVAFLTLLTTGPIAAGDTAPYAPKPPALTTPWTNSVSRIKPLPEYPRPQLRRADWLNLNGQWQYEQVLAAQAPPFGHRLAETILVPFPVSSPLSGIDRSDTAGWYRRVFRVPSGWGSRRVLLNFGAVSWAARVYVNGRLAGDHRGDYDSFSFDITRLVRRTGLNELMVQYWDPIGAAGEPVGKQVTGTPFGAYHTASTGIWQTVWLEPVAAQHVTDVESTPDVSGSRLLVRTAVAGGDPNQTLLVQALAGSRVVATANGRPGHAVALHLPHPRLWSPSDPYLYGLQVSLLTNRRTVDTVRSYFGMRSVSLGRAGGATRILLNGSFVFESGALDQGFWPDGLYTAPTDAALRYDIATAKRLGYNMIRKHAKVEPDRWYYWADRLGIIVWQDMPSMSNRISHSPTRAARAEYRRELRHVVLQHHYDPSIVAWVPFNEGVGQFDLAGITAEIKRLDPARLVDTQSGSANCCAALESRASDIRDTHLYFGPFAPAPDYRASVVGEYGGALPWSPPSHRWPDTPTSIGSPTIASRPGDDIALLRRQYADLTQEMRTRGLSGAVFTELGSYEQETGIVSYDRRVFTINPDVVQQLNSSLIAASQDPAQLRPQLRQVPPGTTGLWHFDAGKGTWAGDASGNGNSLWLTGAGWTRGVTGTALQITQPGEQAMTRAPVIDTGRSFTVSAWLKASLPGQSGTAVSEPGTDGSSFSLGLATWTRSPQTRAGEIASGKLAAPFRTWWTFVVPAATTCTSADCGVQANMHYDDGRAGLRTGVWHQVTGVYDHGTRTVSVYVDGIPEENEPVGPLPPATGPLTVGSGLLDYSPTDAFMGAIDELRTYARALSPEEVWQLYSAQRPRV